MPSGQRRELGGATWWSSCWKYASDINEVCYVYKDLEHSLHRDEKAGGPLHRAIRNDRYDVLRLLLERGGGCEFARCERENALVAGTRKGRLPASKEVQGPWR